MEKKDNSEMNLYNFDYMNMYNISHAF